MAAILERLTNLFRGKSAGAELATSGSQKSVTTEWPFFLTLNNNAPFLLPPFDFNLFWRLYQSNDLAHSIINHLAHMIVSDIKCVSQSEEQAKYVNEWIDKVDLQSKVLQWTKNILLYGCSYLEVVGNRSTLWESDEIIDLKIIDSRSILQRTTKYNEPSLYMQSQLFIQNPSPMNTSFQTMLDPKTIICGRNDSESVYTRYGMPILQPCLSMLQRRDELIEATQKASKATAGPIIFFQYASNKPMSKEERRENNKNMKEITQELTETGNTWLCSSGEQGEYNAQILAPSLPDNVLSAINLYSVSIVVSCGLAPSAIGLNVSSGNVTSFESSSSTSVNQLAARQSLILKQIQPLWDLLAIIEPVPEGKIEITMDPVSLESEKTQSETRTIDINNAILLARCGGIGPQQFATELDLSNGVFDQEKFEEFLSQPQQENNGRDPNVTQSQTSKVKSLNKGKAYGNNPSGGKSE